MINDAHILDSIPAYVLGSLEEEEARLVDDHLAGCYLCRKELESYQAVADQVLMMLPEVAPPADLKPRLLERLHQQSRKKTPASNAWRSPGRLIPIGAFVSLLLIALLAVSTLTLWMKSTNPAFISGPLGMRAIALQNTNSATTASGFVIVAADGKNGVLVVDKLPPLDETQEYQVWLLQDSTETSGALFTVDEDGYRGMRLEAPDSLLSYSSVLVTIEPAGGSVHPTGPPVLEGSLFNP